MPQQVLYDSHDNPIRVPHTVCGSPTQGLLAVVSRGGVIKVSGAPGVELVLEEEGSITGDDPPAHLLFPTPELLVGVTTTGAVLAWDLAEGRRCGYLAPPLDSAGSEERVTSVHSPGRSHSTPAAADGSVALDAAEERYVFVGFESGRVRVAQVFPVCRASGYSVDPRDVSAGAPQELLAPFNSGGYRALGAVTSITCSGDWDGGRHALFGHRYGAIVLWDWVRRKRLAVRGLTQRGGGIESEQSGDDDVDREVTSLDFHPSGEAFVAGFASGCYAVFSVSSSNDYAPPRWVRDVGDDGLCPRQGPTIVRTAVLLVRWVRVRGGEARAWGLLVAGGSEIEEGEEPDGVSLLVPSSTPAGSGTVPPSGGGRAKKKEVLAAALAALETAVFVPFAIGQERLSHVHAVSPGGGRVLATTRNPIAGQDTHNGSASSTGMSSSGASLGKSADAGLHDRTVSEMEGDLALGEGVGMAEELVVLGLVIWNEEVRGEDGRLHFQRASSVQACPIQISPYVALLQLEPERVGPHLSGFAAVTAVASTPLLSSLTILDFVSCLKVDGSTVEGTKSSPLLLRGGNLRWSDSVTPCARDEAVCTSEMLVAGHSNGWLSLWECCGPASRQDGVSILEGRVVMREVPSGARLLGSLPVAELATSDGVNAAVTALDVWVERDHVAAAERNACWVAIGFDSGEAAVLVLSSKMDVGRGNDGSGAKSNWGGGTPLVETPVEISDVQLSDGTAEGGSGGGGGWKRFIGRGGRQALGDGAEVEDAELDAAIAEARAEARAIESRGELNDQDENGTSMDSLAELDDGGQQRCDAEGEEEEQQEHGIGNYENRDLRQELLEAMEEESALGNSGTPPIDTEPTIDVPAEEREEQRQQSAPRKASLTQLALRLHVHSVRCVTLFFDTCASALALVVADAEGVVSVTDVATGSASLLPMRAPQARPCRPSVAVGPLPSALRRVPVRTGPQGQEHGATGALFVLLEGWLNVFDLASRDPVDLVQVPGFASDGDRGGGSDDNDGIGARSGGRLWHEESEASWLYCVDECGVPLVPYASEPLSSFTPPPAHAGVVKQGSGLSDRNDDGKDGAEQLRPRATSAQTMWVSPSASRTALEGYHEHELQFLSDAPQPRSMLVVVRGAVAVVLAIAERDAGTASPFSRRGSVSPNVAVFKGRSGTELVVKSRVTLPATEDYALPPIVAGAGVCMVAGNDAEGKAPRRGCLIATDSSGFVTGFLLPSLSPIFRDRLPVSSDVAGLRSGAVVLSQKSVCNLVGELTVQGSAGVSCPEWMGC